MITIYAQQINLWAVLLGAVLAMGLGYLWYMVAFGDLWAKENKFTEEFMKAQKPSPWPYLLMTVSQIVLGLTLGWFMSATNVNTYTGMLRIVFALWAAFTLVPFLSTYMMSWRSWKLMLIDSGYYLLVLLITGSLLYFWK